MTDDHDLNAAERALGHAPTEGETASGRAAREAWERRLAPMLASADEVALPEALFTKIESVIDLEKQSASSLPVDFNSGPAGLGAEIVQLRRRLSVWKSVSGIALAAAAALAIFVAIPNEIAAPISTDIGAKFVAVVTADDGGKPGLLIHIDTGTGVVTVIPAGALPPDGSSYEMWHLPEGATTPVSLGLLPQKAIERQKIIAGRGDLIAISLEPMGGSPTGQPTLPVYHGTVVRVE